MKRRKLIYWLIQIISWGTFSFLIGIANVIDGKFTTSTAYKLIILYVLLILITHSIHLALIKLKWLDLKMSKLIPRSFGLVIASSILLMLIYEAINFLFFGETVTYVEASINILMYAIFITVWMAIYLTNHMIERARLQEIHTLKLEKSQTENELKTLRDQLNPHFLFNALNSIRALVEIDPEVAKSSITSLSILLRNSLMLGKRTFIQLEEELDLVVEYLKLEKIRYEERLEYKIDNNVDKRIYIPPFLLQGMVENAIKHGISKIAKGGVVYINLDFKNDGLLMEVVNSGKYIESNEKGIGIQNTIRRLNILYKNNARFDIYGSEDKVYSQIWIKKEYLELDNEKKLLELR